MEYLCRSPRDERAVAEDTQLGGEAAPNDPLGERVDKIHVLCSAAGYNSGILFQEGKGERGLLAFVIPGRAIEKMNGLSSAWL